MEGKEIVDDESLLPPSYVSLAQLRVIWLQKQEEKKLRDKQQEEEEKEDKKSNGGEMDVKGKGKEIVRAGYKNKKKKFKKPPPSRKKGKEVERQVEKGISEVASVCMVEGFPVDEGKGGVPDGRRVINGDNWGSDGRPNQSKQNERASAYDGEREYDKKSGDRGRNRLKGGRDDVLKAEPVMEKKEEHEIVEVFSEKCGLGGRHRGGYRGRNKIKENRTDSNEGMVLEKKVDGKGGLRGRNGGGYRERNEIKEDGADSNEGMVLKKEVDGKGGLGGRERGGYRERNEIIEDKTDSNEGMVLEKKVDGKGYGKKWREGGRNGKYRESFLRFKESRDGVVIGSEMEKKIDGESLEVSNENHGFKGRYRNDDRKGDKGREDSVVGESLSDDKQDHVVLMVESVKNGEMEGVGNGYKTHGKWMGSFGARRFRNENERRGNWKGNFRERGYTRPGGFDDRQKGMVWVKKEENSGAVAADVCSSGVQ